MDGSRLIIREDDKPEVVQRRLQQYEEKTSPLVDYYERQGILRRVDGSRPREEVGDEIRAKLASLKFEEHV
jgi:adenylate kinase